MTVAETKTESPLVLITGVTSGIGLELTRLLRRGPWRVLATGRKESLPKISAEFSGADGCILRPLDVRNAKERAAVIEEANACWGGVDILINNAGISYRSVIEEMSEEDELLQLNTNYLGPLSLIRLVTPGMRRKRRGRIINVSSVGGMMAMPTMGSYSASKFALEGASEALWYELKPWNIHVSLVQPGFIHSNSFRHVLPGANSRSEEGAYAAYYRNMEAFIERLAGYAIATPESVARKIIGVMEQERPPLRVPATADAYLFSLIRRLLPRRIYHWVLHHSLPGVSEWGKDGQAQP